MKAAEVHSRMIVGGTLVGLGGLFLLAQITDWHIFALGWPLFVLIPGLVFLTLAIRGGRDVAGLFFPGILVTGTGAILTYQNITGNWESWAYIWTLYPVMVGLALRCFARRTGEQSAEQAGRYLMIGGLVGLVGLGSLFELAVFDSIRFSGFHVMLPLLMVGVGACLIVKNMRTSGSRKRKTDDL